MRADVSGRAGQEYRHVAPLVPVLTVSPVGGRWGELKFPRRPGFERSALDQRIRPLAQSGNMNVDPVLPPVNRASAIAESGLFFRHQRVRQLFDIVRGEVMLVQQDEGLE